MNRVIGFLSAAVLERRLLFFTAVLLALLASTAAAQKPTAPLNLDHFYCYFALGELQRVTVTLQDQFDAALNQTEQVRDLRIVRFCNPVQKTTGNRKVTQILHSDDHLTMYLITPQPIIPRVVIIRNQFGTQRLLTGNAVLLAVPSGKVWPIPEFLQKVPPIPTDLDHFKCYLANGRDIKRRVLLKDQFSRDSVGVTVGVLQPILFCNPVQKAVPDNLGGFKTTPITNPDAHLACYVTTRSPFESALLLYDNQFSDLAQLRVFRPDLLCVPSLKLKWAEVPVPSPLAPPRSR